MLSPGHQGWEEAPQPLGGSVATATSGSALRSQPPAWPGLWLRLRLALRLVLGPRPRRPPGLRSIAASRLRPPARAHLPARPAAPPSGSRAAARPFVRSAWRAPWRTRTSPSPRSPSRRAFPAARGGAPILPAGRERRSAPPLLLPPAPGPSAGVLLFSSLIPVVSRSEPTRGLRTRLERTRGSLRGSPGPSSWPLRDHTAPDCPSLFLCLLQGGRRPSSASGYAFIH